MKEFTHQDQQRIWDEEHKNPLVLKQMDSQDVSSGVLAFYDFLQSQGVNQGRGLEMGCGKGRNVIWLAQKGYEMNGFDFSPAAITEARKRASAAGVNPTFEVQDATTPWSYESDYFDFGIDCFASTDIESPEGRAHAVKEMHRVLKPSGYLLAYLLSSEDEYHKDINLNSPGPEKGSFLHPKTGKFEKTFDEQEIDELYGAFTLIEQRTLVKRTTFFEKEYECINLWSVLQK
ncbi:MAG TPA: class I SAM-dependent methyltransferase [Candidatus Paceibacterota bacterium]|nr:class I SAM-dependent methyltransferase [Candidatus Paceibacterota bacterium]